MVANFDRDLRFGQRAEREFMGIHPWELVKSTDRRWDFETPEGLRVELKTDTYDPAKTPNLFMERWSDIDRGTPGSIWRACEDEVDVFIYWFVAGRFWMECRTPISLRNFLDIHTKSLKLEKVTNKSWVTGGYKVRRDEVEHLFDTYFY